MKFPHFLFQMVCSITLAFLMPPSTPWWQWVAFFVALTSFSISNWIEGRESR